MGFFMPCAQGQEKGTEAPGSTEKLLHGGYISLLHSQRCVGNGSQSSTFSCLFCFQIIIFFLTSIVFPMNPTEESSACFSQGFTVWLTLCHIFKMYLPLGEPGNPRVDNAQRVGKINLKQAQWR